MAGGAPKGNTNATKNKPWIAALERHFAQNPDKLAKIAAKTADAAMAGESWAVQEVANRLDGKPMQPVEHSGEFTQRLAHEYSNAELALIAAGKEPSASDSKTQH